MQEDILGPRQETIGEEYTFCMRCGKAINRQGAVLVPEEGQDETLSEQEELCQECLNEQRSE